MENERNRLVQCIHINLVILNDAGVEKNVKKKNKQKKQQHMMGELSAYRFSYPRESTNADFCLDM